MMIKKVDFTDDNRIYYIDSDSQVDQGLVYVDNFNNLWKLSRYKMKCLWWKWICSTDSQMYPLDI